MNLDRSMKNLIQFKNDFFQSVCRLKAQMSRLINIVKDKNEETLPNTFLTILDCPNHINKNQESWHLGLQPKFNSSYHLELDQYQFIDKLVSFHFNEIELE